MYQSVRQFIQDLSHEFGQIPIQRHAALEKLAAYIQTKKDNGKPVRLVFICTHNSRRSHFGQIAAALAASFYSIEKVYVYSGGTEATAFHPNAIQALLDLGFYVKTSDDSVPNPVWTVSFGKDLDTTCFSKTYDDPANPSKGFAAIMTCSDAEQNCPIVAGAELRIALAYKDPKSSDGTPKQDETYQERFRQIARELLYAFSLVQ